MNDGCGYVLFLCGMSFLLGFKIAAWMGKRHVERLRKIWRIAQ